MIRCLSASLQRQSAQFRRRIIWVKIHPLARFSRPNLPISLKMRGIHLRLSRVYFWPHRLHSCIDGPQSLCFIMLKLFGKLTESNFEAYAIRHYQNPHCLSIEEFYDDLAKFKYIKRLLRKYIECGEIRERLILNHIISIYNVFPISAANHMMFFRIEKNLWEVLKPFLIFLNYLPENMMSSVKSDMCIVKRLQDI